MAISALNRLRLQVKQQRYFPSLTALLRINQPASFAPSLTQNMATCKRECGNHAKVVTLLHTGSHDFDKLGCC